MRKRFIGAFVALLAFVALAFAPAASASTTSTFRTFCDNWTFSAGPTTVSGCVTWEYASNGYSRPTNVSVHNYGYSTVDVTRSVFKRQPPSGSAYNIEDCTGFNARLYPGDSKSWNWCGSGAWGYDPNLGSRTDGFVYVTTQIGVVGYGYDWKWVTDEP